jgi:uncharacterized membrane-anchored protein
MTEFLDKGRAGNASSVLTRLRVGDKLIDAKGVSRLYRSRISTGQLMLLVAATIAVLTTAFVASPSGRAIVAVVRALWGNLVFWFQGLFE